MALAAMLTAYCSAFCGARVWAAPALFAPKSEAEIAAEEKKKAEEEQKARRSTATAAPSSKIEVADLPSAAGSSRSSSGSPEIVIGPDGKKTIVIRGDSTPKAPAQPSGGRGNGVQVLVDENGRKTIVIKGEDEASPASVTASGASAPTVKKEPPAEKPYWLISTPQDDQPYFKARKEEPTSPYWTKEEKKAEAPYWAESTQLSDGCYWCPPKPPKEPEPVFASISMPQGNSDSNSKTVGFYMLEDERGVKHLTNVPVDPRYRRYNITYRIDIARGLPGNRVRFSHKTLRPIIMKAAATYNLDPALIAAVIKSESAFDPKAVSWAGAQGLMQLMPGTARDMGCRDPFDPEQNIMAGSRYLRLMLNRFKGDLTLAVAAYNAGPTRVERNWRVPNIAETQNYVKIVARNYQNYKSQF